MTLVVKLGGSHAFSPLLRPWLAAVAHAAGDAVLVPGGGPFADAVRDAQPRMGYDDAAAHDMALLAMAQYGRALCSLDGRFVLAGTETDIARARAVRRIPVWSPAAMLLGAADVPASWDVTSDSLALWLAARLRADAALLVKHGSPAALDGEFRAFRARYPGRVFVAGPDDLPEGGISLDALPGREYALA